MAKTLMLSKRDELILQAVYYYRFMSAQDVAKLLFSASSKAYVQKILTHLSGGDHRENQYLYRFGLPTAKKGNMERIYTLGSKGRDFLQNEMGLPVDWHFRPEKVRHVSYGQLVHHLFLTRILVCASKHPAFVKMRTSYELSPLVMKSVVNIIPDAWLLFETAGRKAPILLEIDRGTEYQQKFKQHVAARIEFIRSGEYEALFGVKGVTVVYLTTGDTESFRRARVRAMQRWTQEVLAEQNRTNWAEVFRFSSLALDEIYSTDVFNSPRFLMPGSEEYISLL